MISPISRCTPILDLELKPLLLNKYDDHHEDKLLPSIHKVMSPPLSSKNSPPLSYYSNHDESLQYVSTTTTTTNNTNTTFPSPFFTSVTSSDVLTPPHSDLCLSTTSTSPSSPSSNNNTQRKGSIASLLNSDPELKYLDECGYQSHFMNDLTLKRHYDEDENQEQSWLPAQASKRKKPYKQKQYQQQQQQQKQNKNKKINHPHHEDSLSTFNPISNSSSTTTSPLLSSSPSTTSSFSSAPSPPSSSMLIGERATKGLRHFSKQVCDKVKDHGITTYDQVVQELSMDLSSASCHFDQKNIRRRVYDALNVLMAIKIIEKDKKEIKWLGDASLLLLSDLTDDDDNHDQEDVKKENNDQDINTMQEKEEVDHLLKQIQEEELKQQKLQSSIQSTRTNIHDTLTTYLQLCRLIQRNQQQPSDHHPPYSHFPLVIIDQLTTDPIIETSTNLKQVTISYSSHHDDPSTLNNYQHHTFKDIDILQHHFNHHFTSQELSSWLPSPHWQQYLEVSS
ncbi:unnamed protein product [Cunninghamella echinulata]